MGIPLFAAMRAIAAPAISTAQFESPRVFFPSFFDRTQTNYRPQSIHGTIFPAVRSGAPPAFASKSVFPPSEHARAVAPFSGTERTLCMAECRYIKIVRNKPGYQSRCLPTELWRVCTNYAPLTCKYLLSSFRYVTVSVVMPLSYQGTYEVGTKSQINLGLSCNRFFRYATVTVAHPPKAPDHGLRPHSQIDDVGLKAVNHQLCASCRIDLSNAALNDTSVFSSVSLKYQIGHTDGPLRRNTRYQERIFRCPLHRRYRWWVLLSYLSFASVQSARTADISAAVSFAPGRSCSLQLPHS